MAACSNFYEEVGSLNLTDKILKTSVYIKKMSVFLKKNPRVRIKPTSLKKPPVHAGFHRLDSMPDPIIRPDKLTFRFDRPIWSDF
jgi:hypothetical protein